MKRQQKLYEARAIIQQTNRRLSDIDRLKLSLKDRNKLNNDLLDIREAIKRVDLTLNDLIKRGLK